MKKSIFLLILVSAFASAHAQSKQQIITNETAFAKLYGYVKYFYPGDEAASINWDNFAIYGAKKVANCANREALKQTLHGLFNPIVPTLQLVDSNENVAFNKKSIIPTSLSGYKTIAWQHIGGRASPENYEEDQFKSARTNRPIYFDEYIKKIGGVRDTLDATPYRNKEFIFKARVKMAAGLGSGRLFAAVDTADRMIGFLNNLEDNPIIATEWTNFELKGKVNSNGQLLRFGAVLLDGGEFLVDDINVVINDGGTWKSIYTNNFNREITGLTNGGVLSGVLLKPNPDYDFNIIEDANKQGEKWLSVKRVSAVAQRIEKHTTFFKAYPKVGEYIKKNIGSGLNIVMPIALYGNETNTYPLADRNKLAELKSDLNGISLHYNTADSLATRFADLIITWNQFQHFFPYFDVAKTDWTRDLGNAFADAIDDKDGYDFLKTLRKFTAKVKDEHTRANWFKDQNRFFPAITWEWIENKLVVTKVLDKALPITQGDVITAIDNQAPEIYFQNIEQYISAATPGGLKDRSQTEALIGGKGTTLQLSYLNHNNVSSEVSLLREINFQDHLHAYNLPDSIKQIDPNIMYLNIGVVSIKTINDLLPQLQKSKAIICDLRNSMTDNWTTNHFIEYLLTKKDTATHWGQTAHTIYPDQEHLSYETEGFDLLPAKPHLNAKIFFLVDATDYSWAETYISIIAHYKLATIVGQPTAGTNGDVNILPLPGGYQITYSGVKITQLDLSPHQGVGTKPDVYVTKTIKGIREGKDELLEKAIEIATSATPR